MEETEEEKCEGSELSIQIRDFTETATNYSLTVTDGNGYYVTNSSYKSWKDEKMKVSELNPRTKYTFKACIYYDYVYCGPNLGVIVMFCQRLNVILTRQLPVSL